MEGTHQVSVVRDGYSAWDGTVVAEPNTDTALPLIRLQPANAKLLVNSIPRGANVTVNGRYRGQSPLTLDLAPNVNYEIGLSKAGYGISSPGRFYQRILARWSGSDRDHAPGPEPEDRLAVLDALRDLTERERTVIVLRYYEDLPDVEIAEIIGCSRSTVRSVVHRALPKLRERLDPTYGPGRTGADNATKGSGRDE